MDELDALRGSVFEAFENVAERVGKEYPRGLTVTTTGLRNKYYTIADSEPGFLGRHPWHARTLKPQTLLMYSVQVRSKKMIDPLREELEKYIGETIPRMPNIILR